MLIKGEVSAVELAKACLDRIKFAEDKISALNMVTEDIALENAKDADKRIKEGSARPLTGIPGIIKDNILTKGLLTTCSSRILENFVAPYNATVVEFLKEQGYVLVGKANMDEFAMGSSTEYSAFKKTKNPWDLSRVPGGSSGGSAAAVSAEEAFFALGSDTGGSIRQPSSYCGVVGMKPTYGAVSRYGLVAFASSLDQIGPITRNVYDMGIVLNAICKPDAHDSTSVRLNPPDFTLDLEKGIEGMRIGIPKEYLTDLPAHTKDVIDKSIKVLEGLGAKVELTSLPTFDYALSAYYIISSAEATSNLSRFDGIKYGVRAKAFDIKEVYYNTRGEFFGDEVKRRIMLGNYVLSSGYYDAFYLKALKVRTLIKADFDNIFKNFDVIFSPVTADHAFKLGEKRDPLSMYLTDVYTVPVNIAGLPAISVPSGLYENGMPSAVQFIGPAFCESTLLRVAHAFESEIGFTDKPGLKEVVL